MTIFSPHRARSAPTCSPIGTDTVIRKDASFSGYRADGGRDPDRPDHDRRGRRRRRDDRARHRHLDGRRRPARARLVAAHRAVGPGGRALARLARAAHRRRLPRRRPGPLRQRPAVRSTAACSCSTCWCSRRRSPRRVLWVLQTISYVSDIVGPGAARGDARRLLPRAARCSRRRCCSAASSLGPAATSLTVPRAAAAGSLRPGKVYRLYGIRYWVAAVRSRALTNSSFFVSCFGDSSYIVTTCAGSATDLPRSGRPARTSAPTLTPRHARTCARSARTRWSPTGCR